MNAKPGPTEQTAVRNPYVQALTAPVTLRLPPSALAWFDQLAAQSGLGREQTMELFLRHAAYNKQRLDLEPAPQVEVRRKAG